jgi:multiple sugar transport system substrate-binding protein
VPQAEPTQAPSEEVVTLEFWNGFNAHEVDSLNKMIEKYWAPSHPNIKINAKGETSPESILTAMSGGTPPDVAILWDAYPVTLWARQGAIMDLTPHIEAAKLNMDETFVPAGLAWTQYKGHYYGLPFVNFNNGLYWNKALFREAGLDPDKPPQTIAEVQEYARKLTKVADSGEITQLGWMPISSPTDLAMSFGGKFYDSATGKITANDPKVVESLTWDLTMAQEYGLEKVNSFMSGFQQGGGDHPFFLGKVGMAIMGCWQVTFIKEYHPDLEYGVGPIPASDPAYARSNNVGTNPIVIPKNTKHPNEAWEFAMFLSTNPDISREFADLISNIPHVKAALANFSSNPNTQLFVDLSNSPNARAWAPLPIVSFYQTEWDTAVQKVFAGQATPQEALDTVTQNVQAELDKLQ